MCCGGIFLPPPDHKPPFTKADAWEHLFCCIGIGVGGATAIVAFISMFIRCLMRDCHADLWADPTRAASALGGAFLIFCLLLATCPGGVRLFLSETSKCLRRLREPD